VIHVTARTDWQKNIRALQPIFEDMKACLSWTWEVVSAEIGYQVAATNCLASHRDALRLQSTGLNRTLLVLEDDASLEVSRDEFLAAFDFLFSPAIMPLWEIVRLHVHPYHKGKIPRRHSREKHKVYKFQILNNTQGAYGTLAYIAKPNARKAYAQAIDGALLGYDAFGKFNETDDAADNLMLKLKDTFILEPRLFGQAKGWSDIKRRYRAPMNMKQFAMD
jgi:GR25 family glycosyltransferase involved in LPS biosynthesis